ncbi:MAG: hypothetical protein AAF443_04475 [Chlamydiota bacterium]
MIAVLGDVLHQTSEEDDNDVFGSQVRRILDKQGGIPILKEIHNKVSAYHQNNYLPLLWSKHVRYRSVLFQLLDLIQIASATQDQHLLVALDFVKKYRHSHRKLLPYEIDLGFLSQRWLSFVQARKKGKAFLVRRFIEVCVFTYLAHSLQCGDIFVIGSEKYADYRKQLLSWEQCKRRLNNYCAAIEIPNNSRDFVDHLKQQLAEKIRDIDKGFPSNSELTIDPDGIPHLKRQKLDSYPEGFKEFEEMVISKMPERHLLFSYLKRKNGHILG